MLLINKSDRRLRVAVRLPTTGAARVQRLLARSAGAENGVTLGGQRLNGHARWVGRRRVELIRARHGRYVTEVRRFSAVLLSARLRA